MRPTFHPGIAEQRYEPLAGFRDFLKYDWSF
jgi:hypothetical protein